MVVLDKGIRKNRVIEKKSKIVEAIKALPPPPNMAQWLEKSM